MNLILVQKCNIELDGNVLLQSTLGRVKIINNNPFMRPLDRSLVLNRNILLVTRQRVLQMAQVFQRLHLRRFNRRRRELLNSRVKVIDNMATFRIHFGRVGPRIHNLNHGPLMRRHMLNHVAIPATRIVVVRHQARDLLVKLHLVEVLLGLALEHDLF